MRLKKPFSIIELMTVILVILLLMSLLVPIFVNLKMNARTALCKSQMRQIGNLITSYQADHGGYFPNDEVTDIPATKIVGGNNGLYANWNGHLIPYIDVNLPDKYTRIAKVTKVGCTRFNAAQHGGPVNPPPANVLKNGWVVVDDALRIGGYNDLKVFICPEIHQNTFDVAAAIKYNGVKIPRISQLVTGGTLAFADIPGYDYGMTSGVPTTYLANEIFFGSSYSYVSSKTKNSLRVDNIAALSKKALILEGGVADPFGTNSNGEMQSPDYSLYASGGAYGGDLSTHFLYKSLTELQKLSYVHDNYDTFWVMNSMVGNFELASKFNTRFAGKASMVYAYPGGYRIISYMDPEKGAIFKSFFAANPPVVILTPFNQFVDEPNEFKFLTGNMNVLFGDNSVATKDQAWLCNNRLLIGGLSAE
jgi:type II secretory pathway pseudopilin PulG